MITEKSIYKAELIEFEYNENSNLIEKRDNLINNTMVVIQDKYIVDINTYEEYEVYTLGTEVIPGKKYIFKLINPERVDLETHTKALIAFNEFLNRNFNVDPDRKILKFKPKEKRD